MKMLKTLLSAGLLSLALGGGASAYSTKAQIQSEINSNLPTNGQGLITADVLRNTLLDFMNATNFQADFLNVSQVPAFTGDCTNVAGTVAITCGKTGGVAFGPFATMASPIELSYLSPAVVPQVVSNAALAAATIAQYPSGVWRQAYSVGIGTPLFFLPQSGSCTLAGLVNDGGYCQNEASGNSFVAQNGGKFDPRQFGAAADGSTDDTAAWQAALDAACAVNTANSLEGVVGWYGGGQSRISTAGLQINCAATVIPNVIANSASTYDSGVTTTRSVSLVVPNDPSGPNITLSGVWNIGTDWPSATVTSISSGGAVVLAGTVTLPDSSTWTPTVGQYVMVSGSTNNNRMHRITAVTDTAHFTVSGGLYANSTGGTLYGPVPRALFNISTGGGVVFDHGVVDCNAATGCVGIANYGTSQAPRPTRVEGTTIQNIRRGAGFVAIGNGNQTNLCGVVIRGSTNTSNLSTFTGYGAVFSGGTGDNRIGCGSQLSYLWSGTYSGASTADIDIVDSHIFTTPGSPNGVAGPVYEFPCFEHYGAGAVVGNTLDNCTRRYYVASTGAAQPIVDTGNFGEYYSASLITSPIEVICSTTGVASCGLAAPYGRFAVSPEQHGLYLSSTKLQGWLTAPLITLIDGNGLWFSDAWTTASLQQAARLNGTIAPGWMAEIVPGTAGFGGAQNFFNSASWAANGATTSGSRIISSYVAWPTIGATVTDSGSCIPANTTVGMISPKTGMLQLAKGAVATCSNASDTLTVGGVTFAATNVTSGSGLITAVPFPTYRPGMAISGTNVPANVWAYGYNFLANSVQFTDGTTSPTTATGSATNTMTVNPQSYTFNAQDDGSTFYVNATRTLYVAPFTWSGWTATVQNVGTNSPTVTPRGSATLNGAGTAVTIGANTFFTMQASLPSAGATRYLAK